MKICLLSSSKDCSLEFKDKVSDLIDTLSNHLIICAKSDTGLMNFIYQKVYTKNMTKEECDICIILPGGIGTLYEMLEMISREKPILIYNIDGFYTSFIDFIEELKTLHYIDRELNMYVFNSLNELNDFININLLYKNVKNST